MNKKRLFYGIAKFRAIFTLVIATIMVTLVCGFMLYQIGSGPSSLPPRLFVVGFWLIFIPLTWSATFSHSRILKRNKNLPKPYTELESDLDTSYMQPLDRAAVESNEVVRAWYGPMARNDMEGVGNRVGLRENISGENTFLVTDRQIICMMIGPADTQSIETTKAKSLLSDAVELLPTDEGVYNRKQQFETIWFNKWDKIMDRISVSGNLSHVLETHRNYAIPFSLIVEVNIKKRFFNPGIHVSLINGKTLKYAGFNKQRLDDIQSALMGKVSVKSSSVLGL